MYWKVLTYIVPAWESIHLAALVMCISVNPIFTLVSYSSHFVADFACFCKFQHSCKRTCLIFRCRSYDFLFKQLIPYSTCQNNMSGPWKVSYVDTVASTENRLVEGLFDDALSFTPAPSRNYHDAAEQFDLL